MGVDQQTVYERLREMGKIEKTGKWVPHELNDRRWKSAKTRMFGTKGNSFCIVEIQGTKSGFILRMPNAKNHE